MVALTKRERKLLERLAAEGKPTRLTTDDLEVAKSLETDGLLFIVRDVNAVITPKGRHALVGDEPPKKPDQKPPKPPFGFLE
jgi:hypothetical protein